MKTRDAQRELEALLPTARLESFALLKAGLRAHTFTARLGDARVLAKRFDHLDDHASNECTSYRLFGRAELDIAPQAKLIAPDNRWVVVDAVDGRDFSAALAAGDAPYTLMDRLGRTLATLICATVDPDGDARTRRREADALLARWPEVERWSERLGAGPPDRGIIRSIVQCYRDPPVVAWTQGDPAPSNVLYTPSSALLVDFEYAGYRHALHDLAQWSIRIPLRYDWYERITQVVATTLLGRGIYTSETTFDEHHATMSAYAALYMFTWLPIERALEEDLAWAPGFDARSALLSTSNRLAARVRSTYPALAEWSERVFTVLSRRWPEKKIGAVRW